MSRYIWPVIGFICFIINAVSVVVDGKQISNIQALFYGFWMIVFWFIAVWMSGAKR